MNKFETIKRVLCFTSIIKSYEVKRFKEESRKMNFIFKILQYKNISLEFRNRAEFKYKGLNIDIKKEDIVILRNPDFANNDDKVFFGLLICYLNSLGVRTTNLDFFLNFDLARDKLFQYYLLLKNNFPIIKPTYFFNSDYFLFRKLNSMNNAFVIKPRNGSGGVGIFKIEKAMDFIEKAEDYCAKNILMQKYIPNTFDIRVICTQNKIIGAMKRIAKKSSIVNNFSAGGSVENYKIKDRKIEKNCLAICKLFRCDYLGVDIILSKRKYYIIEVNFFCHFKGFEKATGVNFPREIFNLLKQNDKPHAF